MQLSAVHGAGGVKTSRLLRVSGPLLVRDPFEGGVVFRLMTFTRLRGSFLILVAIGLVCALVAVWSWIVAIPVGALLVGATFYLEGEEDLGSLRLDGTAVSWREARALPGRALSAEEWNRRSWSEVLRLEMRDGEGLWAVGAEDAWCVLRGISTWDATRLLEEAATRRECALSGLPMPPPDEELFTSDLLL